MTSIRFASFNASLNRNSEGELITDLSTPDNAQAQAIAEIIQRTNPDVILVNEFDFDEEEIAAQLFQENYLEVSQNGSTPIEYPFIYVAPSNTGIASGFDLDNDGNTVTEIGQLGYGNDSFGFGNFPGQFGMVLYSKFPIDVENIRTFQNFLWQDMPGALLPDNPDTDAPDDWYSTEELAVFRLSSKSHWDIPINVDGEIIHVLASHPTPPVFDGPEDRNGRRNHDEIRFWADYITPGQSDYIYDDNGVFGGLSEGVSFVIMGDQNADPFDGDSTDNAILQVLENPLVNTSITPASEGGPEQAELQGGANDSHSGDPAFDTSDFGDGEGSSGNLRVDYVLPSTDLEITDARVFWPLSDDPLFPLVETSDHRLVWVDLETENPPVTALSIYEIQGNEHISPFVDQTILTTGIVTVVDSNGFYFQDATGDEDDLTSDGIFVLTSDEPSVSIGDEVEVLGIVSEFIPGGADTGNLSITQISDSPGITVISTDNELPEAVIIGVGGRIPPSEIIDNDSFVNFDPEEDGIDFYETLEGMLVQLEDAVAISPTNRFGEIYTIVDDGTDAIRTNDRGGLTISPDDFNPERVQVQRDSGFSPNIPAVNVGDRLGDVTGVVSYSFGNFEVLVTDEFTPTSGNLDREITDLVARENQLTVSSFNVFNLDPNVEDIELVDDNDPGDIDDDIGDGDFAAIAAIIANNLQSPDIIGLQEVQDSDGAEQTGNVDASLTYETLIDAIVEAGGPEYSFFDLPPEDGADGGQPGGNIRVGYLYNPERVNLLEDTAERLGVGEEAFEDTRKSLAVQFEFNDEIIYLVNNHFSSKGGSSPLFGQIQPPINGNEEKREQQAQIINDYVDGILAEESEAKIVVLGDLNEFQFFSPLEILEGGDDPVLTNLTETLPEDERYTFIFQGNSQALDHILISDNLVADAQYDIVHTNIEFADQASDHDPLIASLNLDAAPSADTLPNGVASGDTTQETTVLWTRSTELGNVTFEYATDPNFSSIIDTVVAEVTDPLQPVKVEISDLNPGTDYYYRVTDSAGSTAVGEFTTSAALGTNAGLTFGVSGDWRGELSPYPSISNATDSDLELFVQHGNTIFADAPSPAVPLEQATTLEEFRLKHNEVYSTRFDLNTWEDLRSSTSILATIDDHEVTNNFAGGAPPESDPRFDQTGDFINDTELYENGLQAFQEYNPLRDDFYGDTGDPRTAEERKLYRFNTYGSDAAIIVLDNRSFRDLQLEDADTVEEIPQFLVDSFDPTRTLLGEQQLSDLKADLLQAETDGITWKFVMVPEPIQNLGATLASDRFEGYAAERTEILSFIDENDIQNVVFVAADVHGTVVNNLTYQTEPFGEQIPVNAFEITTGPVAIDPPFGPSVIQIGETSDLLNPEQLEFYNALPVANDGDSEIDDKDDFIKDLINQELNLLGYDPVGLNDNLPVVGDIPATLLQGDYVATHTFGWTEFDIDPETQQLRVVTYGIEPYTEEELLDNPEEIVAREPVIVSEFVVDPQEDEPMEESFRLQILHAADQEGGLPGIVNTVNFSAVINALEDDFENTLKLSSGDIYIAGPFFNASNEIYGEPGIGDIIVNNTIGFQAVAFGNHEFDLGPGVVGNLIRPNPEITGPGIGEEGYQGTAFPYLSANLDFSEEETLADLVVPDGEEPEPNSIASSVVIEVGGEEIGIVGATTPALPSISSIGNITVSPTDSTDIEALAAEIQMAVDALTETGIDKVILLAHMQQISIEEELATLLRDVDVIMAGGSNTLLANPDDPLRDNDTSEGPYPLEFTSASDEPVFVINTDGNYKYVGRLVADFDENGIITDILDESGAYATDDAGVDRVYGEDVDPAEVADPVVVEVTEAIDDLVSERDSNIFGQTEVFLNGTRGNVRTEETNLGNLTADANLFIGQEYDPTVTVSIKNGGGIRDNIGLAIIPPGSNADELEFLPPPANPLVGKEEGNISQLDIENSLRFNNELSLLTVTAEELKQIVEHGVAATEPGATPGQFSQIGGMAFSFDPTGEAIAFERDEEQIATGVLADGDRVRSLAILNEDGSIADTVVRDGEVVGDPNRDIRLVTLSFLANGNDGYPFPLFAEDRVDLVGEPLPAGAANFAEFADPGTEQDALAEYLAVAFPADDDPQTPVFEMMEVPPELDLRIQNLSVREDTVLPDTPPPPPIEGTPGSDRLIGTPDDDIIIGLGGDDTLFGSLGDDNLFGDAGNDLLIGGEGNDLLVGGTGRDTLIGGPDGDTFVLEESDAAVANPSEADLILAFQVNFINPTIPIDTIGLTGGLTEDDLNLELVNDNTFIRVAESNQILGIVTNVTPERLNGTFVLL